MCVNICLFRSLVLEKVFIVPAHDILAERMRDDLPIHKHVLIIVIYGFL